MSWNWIHRLRPLGLFIIFSCSAVVYPDAQTAVLAIGESAQIRDTGISVCFVEVVEDSRCPTGTECFWAGDASVKIRLDMPEAPPTSYILHTNKEFANEVVHAGIRISLVSLKPYPTSESTLRRDEYQITLLLNRK
jgi:hypothetical protein